MSVVDSTIGDGVILGDDSATQNSQASVQLINCTTLSGDSVTDNVNSDADSVTACVFNVVTYGTASCAVDSVIVSITFGVDSVPGKTRESIVNSVLHDTSAGVVDLVRYDIIAGADSIIRGFA